MRQEFQKSGLLANILITDTSIDARVHFLQKEILTLPENQQVVLRLFYTEGYSLNQIRGILEIAIGTVKSRLFHGMEKLKTIFKAK